MNTQDWAKIEESSFPQFTIANMTNYFIGRVAIDGKPAMDYKNMNSHAFPLYKAGHIQSILVEYRDTVYNVRCACLPEMKKDTLYEINISLDGSGDIVRASCACPAGAGPFGSCKHICALCYALEEFCRIKEVRPPESCTSQIQQWNKPRKRKLDACDVDDIQFVKYEYGKKKRQPSSTVYDPRPSEMALTSHHDVRLLAEQLQATGEEVALLHLLPLELPPTERPQTNLPSLPSTEREVIHNEIASQMQPVHYHSIATAGLKFVQKLKYTPQQVAAESNSATAIVQTMARREAIQDHRLQIWCRGETSA